MTHAQHHGELPSDASFGNGMTEGYPMVRSIRGFNLRDTDDPFRSARICNAIPALLNAQGIENRSVTSIGRRR
jgi:hypothetical protein